MKNTILSEQFRNLTDKFIETETEIDALSTYI